MKAPGATQSNERLRELQRENSRLREENERLRKEKERLESENQRLEKELEAARRATKRQAAPFSKGQPKSNPKPPGRKPGLAYGQRACRPVPQRVDEELAVPAPRQCLRCGGTVCVQRVEPQYQEEIVRLTLVRRFDVEVGQCLNCGAHTQGRHPLQTSDALGAANVQLGPEALALGAHLNKQVGLSLGQTSKVLQLGFGLQVSRAGIYRALARMAERAAPTYEQLIVTARSSLVNWMDETGWRVGGRLQWLWVAVSEAVTVYSILPGRGFAQAAKVLGADYDGWLLHDGLRLYYGFEKANHQSCLAHLIRRCRDIVEISSPSASQFARQVKGFLQHALGPARPPREPADDTARLGGGHRTAGSRPGRIIEPDLPRSPKHSIGQASTARATLSVHIPALSRLGCDEQRCRARDSTGRHRAQGVGRQSDLERRSHAADPDERVAYRIAARQRYLRFACGTTAVPWTPDSGTG